MRLEAEVEMGGGADDISPGGEPSASGQKVIVYVTGQQPCYYHRSLRGSFRTV